MGHWFGFYPGRAHSKSEAFGNSVPNEDPDGNGVKFVLDMRFPGQRYDQFTGVNYNYFCDYEPAAGRYIQSDLIGLRGGVSTYAYVFGNPASYVDPLGLEGVGSFNNGGHVVIWERGARVPILWALADTLDILRRGANDMVARNFVGADKFYHCVAMCEASSRGVLDASFAATAGVARELY